MKKSILVVLYFTLLAGLSHSQISNKLVPGNTKLKMSLVEDGIYRINRTDFTNTGININSLDPRTVKVFNKGIQIPIFFQGESDGVFDANDYFDFYGVRNYGGLTNVYDENNFVKYVTDEYYNLYSDTNSYWVEWNGAHGLRMQISDYTTSNIYTPQFFYDVIHLEKDSINWIGEIRDGNDTRNFTNERFLGESWYWRLLYHNGTLQDTFSLPHLFSTPQNASVRIFAYPQAIDGGVPNEHTLNLRINGTTVATFVRNDFDKIDTTINFSSSLLSSTGVNTASVTYTTTSVNVPCAMFFDLFEIKYPKFFKFRNNQSLLLLSGSDTISKQFNLSGFIQTNPVFIYDVKNGIKINSFTNNLDTLKFTGKSNSKFEVVNKNIIKKPFRIVRRELPEYIASTNAADYLIVYNSLFQSQVLQLKNHREAYDNFRVAAVEIQDIYDVFNHGIEDPVAVRNFVRHAYNNWVPPKPKYLCLFGRGSLDPKKNSTSSVYYKNFVPVKGNPTTDNYFANVNTAGFTFTTHLAVGRLPAYTVSEAQAMVDNIVTYETQPPADWMKSFMFIEGGVNASEYILFRMLTDTLINPFIIPKPLSGNPVKIVRADGITFNYSDSIRNQINRGALTINYMGHAGSQDWEIGMSDPNVLNNTNGKFPLIFSMTCYTGKNAEPNFRVFGERFMTMSNKGAIGFIGTSGWGFVFAGAGLNDSLYRAFAKDSVRRIGDIFSRSINKISFDSAAPSVRHTVNCYLLQGDPAVKLALPVRPEFSINNNEYKLSNNNPSVKEDVIFTAYPKNFGLHADSCKIRFQLLRKHQKYFVKDTTIRNFKFSDSVKFRFRLDSNGSYLASIILDNANLNSLEDKSNNSVSFTITTKNILFVPLMPVNNSVIRTDSVEFKGLNPFVNRNRYTIKLLLELDTTGNFNSVIKQTFANSSVSGVSTKFKTLLPRLDTNILYYWRTNAVIDGDSAGWSPLQIFRYNPAKTTDEKQNLLADSNATIYKNKKAQFSELDFLSTNFISEGIKLNPFEGSMYVRSLGSNGAEASYFNIMNKSIHIDGGSNTGLNFLKVRKLDGTILQHKVFKMRHFSSSDSVLNFLNTFDSTYYLMGLNASYVDDSKAHYLLNAATLARIHQFGSTKIDSVRKFGWFDTWSFIGFLNASQNQVAESQHQFRAVGNIFFWIESICSINKTFTSPTGNVSFSIGSSNVWKDFSWNNTLLPGGSIKFDVYGIDRNNQQTLVLSNLTTNNFVNLNGINSFQFPNLKLVSKFSIDTIIGLHSPVLNSFKIHFTPPCELAPDLSSFWQSDTISSAGKEMNIRFNYHNAGNISVPGITVKIYLMSSGQLQLIKTDSISNILKIDSARVYETNFIIPNSKAGGLEKTQFVVEISPRGPNNEFHNYNNLLYFNVYLDQPSVSQKIELYSDGNLVNSGDYVRQKPEFKINFLNTNKFSKNLPRDTSISFILNDVKVVDQKEKLSSMIGVLNRSSNDEGSAGYFSILYFPVLKAGENDFKIIYKTEPDVIDTVVYKVLVSEQLMVKDLYNFPNPMRSETSFMFNLLGTDSPADIKIKIYTVSGRLIKEIDHVPSIGHNRITWDGKDNDGDFIANGTYLYKLITEDNLKTETAVQKLVVLR